MVTLKNVLLVNGLSSGATGVLLVVMGQFAAGLFGVSQPYAFWGTGIFLIAFAILVCMEGFQSTPRPSRVRLISTLDILWVIGSVVIVLFQMFNLTLLGYILIAGVAAWVALMAFLQISGLRKLTM